MLKVRKSINYLSIIIIGLAIAVGVLNVLYYNIARIYIGTLDNYVVLVSFMCYVAMFFYILYDSMNTDIIMCYVALEAALLSIIVIYVVVAQMYMDLRFLVFCIFLISIAACEVAIGLGLLVRYK